MLDIDNETFVVYLAIQKWKKMLMHSKKQAQVRILIFDEASTAVLAEYSDYSNIFSLKYMVEHLEYTKINDYAIKLEEDMQPSFSPIYSLKPIKLDILKTYI